MDALEVLMTRRSVRRYKPDPISRENLEEILQAAMMAPSGVNSQPWYFVAVQDPQALEDIKAIMSGVVEKFQPLLEKRFERHPEQVHITTGFMSTLGGAPVCLLVFLLKSEYDGKMGAYQSAAAAVENALLAAWDKGIASCWMTAPITLGYGPALRARFAPDKGECVAAVTLGYPDQQPKTPPRRDGRYEIV